MHSCTMKFTILFFVVFLTTYTVIFTMKPEFVVVIEQTPGPTPNPESYRDMMVMYEKHVDAMKVFYYSLAISIIIVSIFWIIYSMMKNKKHDGEMHSSYKKRY